VRGVDGDSYRIRERRGTPCPPVPCGAVHCPPAPAVAGKCLCLPAALPRLIRRARRGCKRAPAGGSLSARCNQSTVPCVRRSGRGRRSVGLPWRLLAQRLARFWLPDPLLRPFFFSLFF